MNSISKLLFLSLVITSSFIITSCDKVAELFKADINLSDTISFVIPQSEIMDIDKTQTEQFNVDSFIQAATNNNANLSNLKKAKIKSITLALKGMTDDSEQDFRLFKTAQVSVVSDNNPNPYTLQATNLPNPTKVINIPVKSNDDLSSYFNATSFTYRIKADLNNPPVLFTKDIDCELAIEYTLTVQK